MPQNVQPIIDPSQPTCPPFGRNVVSIKPGDIFHRLTVIEFAGRNNRGVLIWRCRCSCGGETLAYGYGLKKGIKRSCGCLGREVTSKRSTTHGMTKTPTYNSWRCMMRRCYAPADIGYSRYGGRGITVCRQWRESFEAFLSGMGERPSKRHQIERIDNNGNYEPENCRWATRKEQARNRRSQRSLTFDGETLCVTEWAERLGFTERQLRNRIHQGWPVERILTEPVNHTRRMLTHSGETLCIAEWARRTGLSIQTICYRLDVQNHTAEDALTIPVKKRKRRH